MRLINIKTQRLEEFLDDGVPKYAILSHTWGSDSEELTFRDMEEGNINKPGVGSIKLHGCCQQAQSDGFSYAWIDTCCINKADFSELSEAINSMFRWYKRASICYAYLSDVPGDATVREQEIMLRSSRWFSRGWTLQELLAPKDVHFYNSAWQCLGTKGKIALDKITGVPHHFLRGEAELDTASVAQRMSWAAHRETKKKEDIAYCLLGIFDVSMPMIYGEGGERAFFRLQEQIIKMARDDSLLAWCQHNDGLSQKSSKQGRDGRIFAASPSDFATSGHIVPRDPYHVSMNSLELSGGCLRIHMPLVTTPAGNALGLLNCGPARHPNQVVGVRLTQLSPGSDEYVRSKGSDYVLHTITKPSISPQLIYVRYDGRVNIPTGSELDAVKDRSTRRRNLAQMAAKVYNAGEMAMTEFRERHNYAQANQTETSEKSKTTIPNYSSSVALVQRGNQQLVLEPPSAKRHVKNEPMPSSKNMSEEEYWRQEWARHEDEKAIVDVDVRGWSGNRPHDGLMPAKRKQVQMPITVFLYNDFQSQSRTIMTNDTGNYFLRAALEFVPTHVRVLANEGLSATKRVQIIDLAGLSIVGDVGDTIGKSDDELRTSLLATPSKIIASRGMPPPPPKRRSGNK